MKKLLLIVSLVLWSALAFAQVENAVPNPPNPPRLVNDFADLLTPQQEQALEQKLVAYDDSTSNQIAIVTVRTLNGYAAVDYAVALGRKWGVGGKQNNNGVVVLISTGAEDGVREAFIAPGYGLEGAIPDITANNILENYLIPNLRNENYYRAFDQTADALILAAAGEYQAPEGYANRGRGKRNVSMSRIIIGLINLFFI